MAKSYFEVMRVGLDRSAIEDALYGKLFRRADELIEELNLKPPIRCTLEDGHGNVILVVTHDWDADGNPIDRPDDATINLPRAPDLFLTLTDGEGTRAVIKLEIEGAARVN
jgi:hypothetical protein